MRIVMKMQFGILLLTCFLANLCACQSSFENVRKKFKIGKSSVQLVEHTNGKKSKVLFVNVHEDEQTSITAIKQYALEQEICYYYLTKDSVRRITFENRGANFSFDPNRIYTQYGIKRTIEGDANWGKSEFRKIKRFGSKIAKKFTSGNYTIALHNNTPDNYSILSYLPDGEEHSNTKDIYINSDMDPDDFIYTTDSLLFHELKNRSVNVILQTENPVNDGSLSVLCASKNVPYANIECEHGHLEEQLYLIRLAHEIVIQLIN